MCKVEVDGDILCDFLLVADVPSVDARIRIILAEDTNAGAKGNSTSWRHRHDVGPRRWLRRCAKTSKGKRGCTSHTKLLGAVVRDRAHLGQHVLPREVDAKVGSQCGFPLTRNVPGKPDAWLELFLGTMERAIGWESGIRQKGCVSGLVRRNHRIGENLRFPSKTIGHCEVGSELPLVLSE